MSKQYTCDECAELISEPVVRLSGVTGTSGGILLPERFHVKHFCGPACFWTWVGKYKPKHLPGEVVRVEGTEVR